MHQQPLRQLISFIFCGKCKSSISVKKLGWESCWHGGNTCPSENSKLLRWQHASKCAFLAVQIVAIKAVFKDLLLKDMSVTALLTLMHFSLSVICVFFFFSRLNQYLFRGRRGKNKSFAYLQPYSTWLYFLVAFLTWVMIDSRRKIDTYNEDCLMAEKYSKLSRPLLEKNEKLCFYYLIAAEMWETYYLVSYNYCKNNPIHIQITTDGRNILESTDTFLRIMFALYANMFAYVMPPLLMAIGVCMCFLQPRNRFWFQWLIKVKQTSPPHPLS